MNLLTILITSPTVLIRKPTATAIPKTKNIIFTEDGSDCGMSFKIGA